MSVARFSWEPIEELLVGRGIMSSSQQAAAVGVTLRQIDRYRSGCTLQISNADRISTSLGYHPIELWPDTYHEWATR